MNELRNAAKPLDLDSVRIFLLLVELRSFTAVAKALGSSVATISLKLKKLEDSMFCRLLDRNAHSVSLTTKGRGFVPAARELMSAHERAIAQTTDHYVKRLSVGIASDIVEVDLSRLLARLGSYDATLLIDVRSGEPASIAMAFEREELDVAVLRPQSPDFTASLAVDEARGWFASKNWRAREGVPLPVASLAAPYDLQAVAAQLLDCAAIEWRQVFVADTLSQVSAAIRSGIAVGVLPMHAAPTDCIDISHQLRLPALPPSKIIFQVRRDRSYILDMLRAPTNGASTYPPALAATAREEADQA